MVRKGVRQRSIRSWREDGRNFLNPLKISEPRHAKPRVVKALSGQKGDSRCLAWTDAIRFDRLLNRHC